MPSEDLYLKQEKYVRTEENKWTLPDTVEITQAGKKLVEADPNISDETLRALILTEMENIPPAVMEMTMTLSKQDLYEKVFLDHDEIGLAHVSQCITDDKNQTLADLIARYADDRRMAFVVGAIYLKAMQEVAGFFFYKYSPSVGYKKIRWSPTDMYVPPAVGAPPRKKKRRIRKKPLTAIPQDREYPLYACPLCGSPARLFRTGKNSRMWHACCMDPEETCINFAQFPMAKTEKMAMTEWNTYVLANCKDPIWSEDVIVTESVALDEEDDGNIAAE